jgi:hypothetical protein
VRGHDFHTGELPAHVEKVLNEGHMVSRQVRKTLKEVHMMEDLLVFVVDSFLLNQCT